MTVFVFPGQGSQFAGMGRSVFDEYPDLVAQADEILGYSIRRLCSEHGTRLNRTQYAQPAIYTVNILVYLHFQGQAPIRPSYVLGHSLGEYCALFAAGVFDFATGLRLVTTRAELMRTAPEGAMAAVLGLTDDEVNRVIDNHGDGAMWIANVNAPKQIVVSGYADRIRAAHDHFVAAGATRYVVLPVSGAFHSPLMRNAHEQFERILAETTFNEPRIPVVANVSGRLHAPKRMRAELAAQISGVVRWADSIRWLLDRGETHFIEIGARQVLTPLIAEIA
jgi:trans-AT polyketide synthase/acyltransferase/oxidoreductase domain-containing protein